MHKEGSYTVGIGPVSRDERIRKRRGIAVAWMPSASVFRSIRPANSYNGRLSLFAVAVDTVIFDFLPLINLKQESRIRQVFSSFRLPSSQPAPIYYARA